MSCLEPGVSLQPTVSAFVSLKCSTQQRHAFQMMSLGLVLDEKRISLEAGQHSVAFELHRGKVFHGRVRCRMSFLGPVPSTSFAPLYGEILRKSLVGPSHRFLSRRLSGFCSFHSAMICSCQRMARSEKRCFEFNYDESRSGADLAGMFRIPKLNCQHHWRTGESSVPSHGEAARLSDAVASANQLVNPYHCFRSYQAASTSLRSC